VLCSVGAPTSLTASQRGVWTLCVATCILKIHASSESPAAWPFVSCFSFRFPIVALRLRHSRAGPSRRETPLDCQRQSRRKTAVSCCSRSFAFYSSLLNRCESSPCRPRAHLSRCPGFQSRVPFVFSSLLRPSRAISGMAFHSIRSISLPT
jgi:hypothetical protein